MSHTADEIAHDMHSSIGGVAGAAFTAWVLSRDDAARRQAVDIANRNAAAAAAHRARAAVLYQSNAALRERLADAADDLEVAEAEIYALRKQVAELTTHRRVLAAEVTKLRGARVAA